MLRPDQTLSCQICQSRQGTFEATIFPAWLFVGEMAHETSVFQILSARVTKER